VRGRLATAARLARTALRYELAMWRSLFRWTARRPAVPAGGTAFAYAGVITPVLLAFIVVSAIEVPVFHLLLPWEAVRLVVDAAGVYGLLWMVGLLASLKVHPHVVEDGGLRVRNGASLDVLVPWEDVAAVRYRMRSLEGMRNVQVAGEGPARALSVGTGSQTNVDIELCEPRVLPVRRTGGEPVTVLRLYADDPKALVARVRAEVAARAST
jgi:Bacterial PH domain